MRVEALFQYQTVYDPTSERLVALEEIPLEVGAKIEAEFLGDRSVFLEGDKNRLALYVRGKLEKKTMTVRPRYAQVLDLKRLKEDIRMNCVNERSFHCVDKSFFLEGFALSDKNRPHVRLAPAAGTAEIGSPDSKNVEEEKKATGPSVISKKPGKQVEDDDFGFCFSEEEDEGPKNTSPSEVELKVNLFENKLV